MTRERLQALSYEDLIMIAQKGKIYHQDDVDKDELVSSIIDAYDEDQREREEMFNLAVRMTSKKYDVSLIEELDLSNDEDIELPESYNENRMVFMLRDPSWAFLYWDMEEKKKKDIQLSARDSELFIRISEWDLPDSQEGKVLDSFDIPVTLSDTRRYINLPEQDSFYRAELRILVGEKDLLVLQSNFIESSREFIVPSRTEKDVNSDLLIKLSGFSTDIGNFPGNEGRGLINHRILPVDSEEI